MSRLYKQVLRDASIILITSAAMLYLVLDFDSFFAKNEIMQTKALKDTTQNKNIPLLNAKQKITEGDSTISQSEIDAYIENKYRIKGFNMDYAALIATTISTFLVIVTLMIFREYGEVKTFRKELETIYNTYKNKLEQDHEQLKEMTNYLHKHIDYVEKMKEYNIKKYNKKTTDEIKVNDYYVSIFHPNKEIRMDALRNLIPLSNKDTIIMTGEKIVSIIENMMNDKNESADVKEVAFLAYKSILNKQHPII